MTHLKLTHPLIHCSTCSSFQLPLDGLQYADFPQCRQILLDLCRAMYGSCQGTIFGILVDRTGPVVLCILGAVLQSLSLLLMGWTDGNPSNVMDPLLLAFVIGGVGGTALMIQSLKLAFIVAPARFALVMTVPTAW